MIQDPLALHGILAGLTYPADRASVLEHARRRGATNEFLRHLAALPNRSYEGVDTLLAECAKSWRTSV